MSLTARIERFFEGLQPADPAFGPVYITNQLLQESARLIATFAEQRPSEGIVYWFGLEGPHWGVVTTLVVPDADTSTGAVHTSELANAQALRVVIGTPLVLLGQAHSHPGSWVKHSETDDEETFARHDGMLSLVIPYFARYGADLTQCGLYRHAQGYFQRVRAADVGNHLTVIPGMEDLRGVPRNTCSRGGK